MTASARSETIILAAAVAAGIVLSCTAIPVSQFGWSPALFPLPLALALMSFKHLRPLGALYVALVVSASFFAATYASIIMHSAIHANLCIFCTAEEALRNVPKEQIVGATGGLVGGLLPFLAISALGPDMRDRTALYAMAAALPLLALFGAIGLSGYLPFVTTPLITPNNAATRLLGVLVFIVPWQIVFGGTLAFLLRRHTPKPRAAQPSSTTP